jgi:polyhydroxybutyrate depolymerase
MKRLFAIAVLLLASAGQAATVDIGRGEIPLVVPANYEEGTPAPLVVLVHGYTSSGAQQESYFKLSALADEYGFFFIAPDGTVEKAGDKNRFWHAGDYCCNFQGSTVNDAAYLKTLIDAISARYSIDDKRIFMSGHSNGGFMVHRMAYEYPDTIAAVVALNGAAPNRFLHPKPTNPVSILHIHGTVDRLNDYNGGDIAGVPYPGALTGARNWAYYAYGSATGTELEERIDLDMGLEGAETAVTQFADGNVEVWTIEDGGHVPAFAPDFNRRVIEWMFAHPKK